MKKWFSFVMIMIIALALFSSPYKLAAEEDEYMTINVTGPEISYTDTQEILDRINEIRWEACVEGIELDGHVLTKEDYVPIQWSTDLEEIAIQRAAEATYLFSHTRPDGTICFEVHSSNGQESYGECLASYGNAIGGINQFYAEKTDLVNKTGKETGHYLSLISPRNKYVGVACFGATAAEFSSIPGASSERIAYEGERRTTSIRVSRSSFEVSLFYEGFGTAEVGETDTFGLYILSDKSSIARYKMMIPDPENISWSISDPSVASIDSNGVIKGLKAGTVTVTASYMGFSASKDYAFIQPHWEKQNGQWKYNYGDDTYVKQRIKKIGNNFYAFDDQGYMIKSAWLQLFSSSDQRYYDRIYVKDDGRIAENEWTKINGSWYFLCDNITDDINGFSIYGPWYNHYYSYDDDFNGCNNLPATGWKKINGYWYYFNGSGVMQTGWQKIGGSWYYLKSGGDMAAEQWIDNTYYVKADGKMAVSEWVDHGKYYVDANGRYMKVGWIKDSKGYWYQRTNGTYPKNQWSKIDGQWYHFDSNGYMQTGWLKLDGTWYYLKPSGAMAANEWQKINGQWYHFNASGYMQTGWLKLDSHWFYLKSGGAMATNEWQKINGQWYHFDSSGYMQTGWLEQNGVRYYLDASGHMQTGWLELDSARYYLDSSGRMYTGWLQEGDNRYYLKLDGTMAVDEIIDDKYIIDSNGLYFGEVEPEQPEQPETPEEPGVVIGTVYWVQSGEVYHISEDCPTLSRSKNVSSGSLDEAKAAGHDQMCKVCGNQ